MISKPLTTAEIFRLAIEELDEQFSPAPRKIAVGTGTTDEHARPLLGDMVKTPWTDKAEPIIEIQDGAYYVQRVGFLHEPMFSRYYSWNASTHQWEMRK